MSKYPEIVIDKRKNAVVTLLHKLDTDQYYDFMHHTHRTSDLVDDSTDADILSAYKTWLSLGNTGTEQDFIDLIGKSVDTINDHLNDDNSHGDIRESINTLETKVNSFKAITDDKILALFE